jgi:hypothetical protein
MAERPQRVELVPWRLGSEKPAAYTAQTDEQLHAIRWAEA